ncbi:MAG: hypothetical protein V4689_21295 [Verrucomicrobiota bacterium]
MELTNIEKFTQKLLRDQLNSEGETLFGEYLHERAYLFDNLLEEIKNSFPDGTDHGPRHIVNVLNNADRLLDVESLQRGNDKSTDELCSLHWLCLISSILYHDVGNVIDRKDHQHKVEEIYNKVWGQKAKNRMQHRDLIRLITRAHCGTALDGSSDTLKEVSNKVPFRGKPIRAQELSAIIRLADELAEGEQRTSLYRLESGGYSAESIVYHEYAKATHVTIDKSSRRIALTYYINVERGEDGEISDEPKLRKLIEFIFHRIQKLDEERQYTRHYTGFLDSFKETSIAMNFSVNGSMTSIGLSELVITDLKIPGAMRPRIAEINSAYDVDRIVNALKSEITEKTTL